MKQPRQEQTFVLIKPDAVRKGLIGEIIRRFEQRDLKVVALEMFQPTFDDIDNHYSKDEKWITRLGEKALSSFAEVGWDIKETFHTDDAKIIGPQVRGWLIEYLSSAPLVKVIIEGAHAISMVRKIIGPTMPYRADMGTIRGDFSNDSPALANREKRVLYNVVHASEDQDEATHEIQHWFGKDFSGFSYKRFGVDE